MCVCVTLNVFLFSQVEKNEEADQEIKQDGTKPEENAHKAATKIQASFRGHITRKKMKDGEKETENGSVPEESTEAEEKQEQITSSEEKPAEENAEEAKPVKSPAAEQPNSPAAEAPPTAATPLPSDAAAKEEVQEQPQEEEKTKEEADEKPAEDVNAQKEEEEAKQADVPDVSEKQQTDQIDKQGKTRFTFHNTTQQHFTKFTSVVLWHFLSTKLIMNKNSLKWSLVFFPC